MEIEFGGKRALVTGAGKGIGRRVAIILAESGAEVLAISRTQSDLDELSKEHSKIKTLCLDVGNWEATKEALQDIGPIDLLVNNAGILEPKEFGEMTEEFIDNTYNINVKAIVNITQIIANGMKARGEGGSIVNVSSILGFQVAPPLGAYCSSKGAMDQLTRSMAVEFGPHKIRVNSVNPTAVRTRMAAELFEPDNQIGEARMTRTPLRRFAEVDDIAYPIVFLLSEKASMITGVVLPIDGGLTVLF